MTIVMLLEYARSGRSTCRAKNCKDIIEKGVLRFGEPYGSNPHTREPTNIGFRHWECMTPYLLKAVKQQGGARTIAGFDKLSVEDQYVVMKTLKEPVPDVAPSKAKNEKRKRGDNNEEEASERDASKEAAAKKRKTDKGGNKRNTTKSTKEERASTSASE